VEENTGHGVLFYGTPAEAGIATSFPVKPALIDKYYRQ
jgi:hypothetical protein